MTEQNELTYDVKEDTSPLEFFKPKVDFLPWNAGGISKTIEVNIKLCEEFTFAEDDTNYLETRTLLDLIWHQICEMYGEQYMFHAPDIHFRVDSTVLNLRVHLLEKKVWEEMQKQRKENRND